MSKNRRSKSIHGNGAGALTPSLIEIPPAPKGSQPCKRCDTLSAIIERFKKVVHDKELHIQNQASFISKMKNMIDGEGQTLAVSPLGREARKGKGL